MEFTLCYKIRKRLLGQVYHFSLLICYPYSFSAIDLLIPGRSTLISLACRSRSLQIWKALFTETCMQKQNSGHHHFLVLRLIMKTIRYDLLGAWSFFQIFCFFLDDCLGRWIQWMWLVSCRRQGMLTQGPTPDPKCELNITSFLTLPHPSHCPICAKDIMVIVLLLQVMGGWEGWGVVHLS